MTNRSDKPIELTLVDIAHSLAAMDARIGSIETNMVTKDEFKKSIDRLEATIRHEAGDLGESISSLSNMVDGRFNGVNARLDNLETNSGPKWRKYIL